MKSADFNTIIHENLPFVNSPERKSFEKFGVKYIDKTSLMWYNTKSIKIE